MPEPVVSWIVVLTLLTLSGLAANVATLVRMGRVQRREVTFGAQAVSRDVAEAQSKAMDQRLAKVEKSVDEIWATMRSEDQQIRTELRQSYTEIERALGRIEGQIVILRRRLDGGSNDAD